MGLEAVMTNVNGGITGLVLVLKGAKNGMARTLYKKPKRDGKDKCLYGIKYENTEKELKVR